MPWNSKFKPKLFGRIREWGDAHYEHVWDNGILDTLFDGLEEEIARVNKKLGDAAIAQAWRNMK